MHAATEAGCQWTVWDQTWYHALVAFRGKKRGQVYEFFICSLQGFWQALKPLAWQPGDKG